jgi:DNA polymerase epsilon subunit 1
MEWVWRGDYSPATKNEYDRTKDQLSREVVTDGAPFHTLPESEQATLVASRLKTYARNAYKKVKVTEEETRNDVVCMRENDYYVDTVRQFRDRRYEYKKLTKTWKKKVEEAKDAPSKKEAEDRTLVYDSLQVAHKCILNSFYGYVMRKGARWRSMEMAGIVTKTGADLITQARIIVEQIGRPLELDTDGIWCILPNSFPAVYTFVSKDGSRSKIEYPGVMLNADVNKNFTNHQYQTLQDPERGIYKTHSECSLFFEVDGPYRCMVLPASTEEGKLLKKRYAVFNFDGSLAELKGFELKRRGELELIKTFQSQVFERFLDGDTLEECYESVAEIANHWLDVIDTRGESLDDDELIGLISENRSMSRQLEDYGDQKGTSQTTARRLGEFLGAEIIKDKGLNCKFIIAEQPYGAPVTDRAIPTAIWKAEPAVMKHYLRKWLKSPGLEGESFDIRNVLDWDYYLERLSKTIQKIITIPAALQNVKNPVPRVSHPDWLNKKVRQMKSRFQQRSIQSMFKLRDENTKEAPTGDIEDVVAGSLGSKRPVVRLMKRLGRDPPQTKKTDDGVEQENSYRVELSKESFGDWLQQRKKTWRTARKRRRGTDSLGLSRQQDKRRLRTPFSSLEGFVRDAALALTQREWQIIEIREMTSVDQAGAGVSATGEVVAWVMVGGDSLQKIHITVPRIVYVSSRCELDLKASEHVSIKKVERHLPHGKNAAHLYELSMPEYVFRAQEWASALKAVNWNQKGSFLDSIYESATPPVFRALIELGCVSKVNATAQDAGKGRKSFTLSELCRVDRPTEGEYLSIRSQFKRIFLYFRVHPRSKVGIGALFIVDAPADETIDLTRPNNLPNGTFDVGASCHFWIVKPGSEKGQRNVSAKQADSLLAQILETVHTASNETTAEGRGAEYLCIYPASACKVSSLHFANNETSACAGINEVISSHAKSHGPTFLVVNSSKDLQQLRRLITSLNSFPVIPLPFPPGPAHNPAFSSLPALNWELPAIQLCMEAYLHMNVVSFPKRSSFARYGHLAVGNLGDDEASVLYDISFARQLKKNRTVSWASRASGHPDLGQSFLPSSDVGAIEISSNAAIGDQNQLWGGDDELISPVIRRPGCYRSVCVDFDIHDLAIAALTDVTLAQATGQIIAAFDDNVIDPSSPTSVGQLNRADGLGGKTLPSVAPLGNDMSALIGLSVVRGLANAWLHDAFSLNSHVADDLLHHVYRLVSSPETLMHDPALHRSILSLMKVTFYRLLSELQRLGCTIVCANFHRVTVATSKCNLVEAEEYADFIVSTIRNRSGNGGHQALGLGRIALQPRQFHSHFVFLDEYNFGGMLLERQSKAVNGLPDDLVTDYDGNEIVLPSVVSAWSIMRYLGSELAQEYFRVIVGRFSKDVLRKEIELQKRQESKSLAAQPFDDPNEALVVFKKKMISTHFADYATRAIGEILNGESKDSDELLRHHNGTLNPALEFIKNVTVVFELDADIEAEVYSLKKSMLAQVGVPEYAEVAQWRNPCPTFILPDVFCVECFDSCDVNLCYTPTDNDGRWSCEDCGTPYDIGVIERRLIDLVCLKLTRYQMQDCFCSKTKRVGTRALARQSECSATLQLDTSVSNTRSEIEILHHLAKSYELEYLLETTKGILSGFLAA